MRAFIALDISDELRSGIGEIIERIKKGIQFSGASPRWSRPEGMHLTLRFLGEIQESKVEPFRDILKQAVKGIEPFNLEVGGLGVFPDKRKPRVVWLGVQEGAVQAGELQKRLEQGVINLGFSPESRKFHPHLTLARIKTLRGTRALIQVIASHEHISAGSCVVDRVILFKSELRPAGAVYSKIIEQSLKQ